MSHDSASLPISRPPRVMTQGVFLLCVLGLVTAAAFAGYQRIFSVLLEFDDEGYLMISLKSYLAGNALYDETYTQYGPAYYLLYGAFHRVTGLPITHDITRIRTLIVWLLVSGLSMFLVHRVTSSRTLSLIAFLLVFFHSERLAMEPGHPQELCLLAICGCLALGPYLASSKTNAWASTGVGLLCAVVLMTKINVGVFLFTGISIAMLLAAPRSTLRSVLVVLFVAGAATLPLLVVQENMFHRNAFALPLIVTISIVMAVFVGIRTVPERMVAWRSLWLFWTTFLIASGLFAGGAVATGTSPFGLYDGLVLQPAEFARSFGSRFLAFPLVHAWAAPCALLTAFVMGAALRGLALADRVVGLLTIAILIGVCVCEFTDTFRKLSSGFDDRGFAALLISFAGPLAGVMLLPRRERESPIQSGQGRSPSLARRASVRDFPAGAILAFRDGGGLSAAPARRAGSSRA